MRLFRLLYPIVPSGITEHSSISDQVPEVANPDESAEPGSAASEEKSNWRSTAVATAKLTLRGDVADTFGPHKSVAGRLYFILENCEV